MYVEKVVRKKFLQLTVIVSNYKYCRHVNARERKKSATFLQVLNKTKSVQGTAETRFISLEIYSTLVKKTGVAVYCII